MWQGDPKALQEFGLHDVMNCVERHHPWKSCERPAFWRISSTVWGMNTKHGATEFTAAHVILRDLDGNYWPEPAAEFLDHYTVTTNDSLEA